jgi:hypothetical protein
MRRESILSVNDIEKHIAGRLIQKLTAGEIPAKGQDAESSQVGYEYYCVGQEKIIRGSILGCPYKLRYRDRGRVFFSAWDCKDVCSMFYDMVAIIHVLAGLDPQVLDHHWPFDVDTHTERYVFFTGEAAASFALAADYICKETHKIAYNSQYILSVFDEPQESAYTPLIQRLKAEGYSKIQILQVWIRGEILYYAIADGAVLRPEYQRSLSGKEEEDLARKIDKTVHKKSRPVDLREAT